MFRNTGDETEILLGNKQLLSIFFVIAALLGLVFAAGYMVGRNSSDSRAVLAKAALTEEASNSTETAQTPGETRTVPAEGRPDRPSPVANEAQPDTSAVSPPSQSTPKPAEDPLRTKKPTAESVSPSREKAAVSESAGARKFAPQAGQTFLQVAAVGRSEADMLSDVLNRKGFRAYVTSGPTAKTFRVLVGPLRSSADISFTRDDLVKKGFKGREAFIKRY